jgi:hypothetical protein
MTSDSAMLPHPKVEAKGGLLHATFLLNFLDKRG